MITKKNMTEFIKTKLSNDKRWAQKALITIYKRQTEDEKINQNTSYHNEMGFSGVDAFILSSLAKQLLDKKYLSNKQMGIIYKKIPKYHKQIIDISNKEKLKYAYYNDYENIQTKLNLE